MPPPRISVARVVLRRAAGPPVPVLVVAAAPVLAAMVSL
ncbi:DNA-binding response regulator, partial [Mycobacterium tuberculosis]